MYFFQGGDFHAERFSWVQVRTLRRLVVLTKRSRYGLHNERAFSPHPQNQDIIILCLERDPNFGVGVSRVGSRLRVRHHLVSDESYARTLAISGSHRQN